MRRFLFGFIAAVVIVLLAEFLWVRLGFVDPRADKKQFRRALSSPTCYPVSTTYNPEVTQD
jgi:hypothetical protein